MGNPHPTRSKPRKIGRKHTGEPSERVKQARRNTAMRRAALIAGKRRKVKALIHLYFLGELEYLPLAAVKNTTPPMYEDPVEMRLRPTYKRNAK